MNQIEKLETKYWIKTLVSAGIGIVGICCTVGNSYKCGQVHTIKRIEENGYDPFEVLQDSKN